MGGNKIILAVGLYDVQDQIDLGWHGSSDCWPYPLSPPSRPPTTVFILNHIRTINKVQSLFVPRNKSCTDDARGASIWIGDGHRLQQRCHHHPRHLLPHRGAHVPRRVCRSVRDPAKLKAPYGHYRGLVCVVYHVCTLEARGIIWPLLISIS